MSRADRIRRRGALAACASLALLASCAGNPAPDRWLPTPLAGSEAPWGAWITVHLRDTTQVAGELLAVDRDTVFVLPLDSVVLRVSIASVRDATVAWFDSDWEQLALWTGLGTVSAVSHGFGLILTMPAWGIIGSLTAASESRAPFVRVSRVGWGSVRQYARFPAGAPANLPERLPVKPPRSGK